VTPADHVIDLFKAKLRERIDQTARLILSGGAEDHARYRELIGELRAFNAAMDAAKEALKAATEPIDDET